MTAVEQGKSRPSGKGARLRVLVGAMAALAVVAVGVYLPRGWAAYQQAKLRNMPLLEIESLVKKQPENVEAQYQLGLGYARAGRYREAIHAFLAAIERQKEPNARTAAMLNDLGVAYLLEERYYESLLALQQAIALKPDFGAAYANLGRLHLATKMPFTATKELQKASDLEPQNLSTLCDLGEAHQQTLNQQGAEAAYQKALQISPHYVPALVGLGKTYYSEGKREQAIQTLDDALKQSADLPVARLTLARMQLEKSASPAELQSASDLIQQALHSDPNNPDAWYDLGRIALRQNQPAEAIADLTKALQLSPQHNGALHQLERALRAVGRVAEADRTAVVLRERSLREREETRLEEQIEHTPQDRNVQAQLAALYLQSGKRGLAMLLVQKLQQNAPDDPRLPALQQALNRQAAQSDAASKER